MVGLERIRGAKEDIEVGRGPKAGGMGRLWAVCGQWARRASRVGARKSSGARRVPGSRRMGNFGATALREASRSKEFQRQWCLTIVIATLVSGALGFIEANPSRTGQTTATNGQQPRPLGPIGAQEGANFSCTTSSEPTGHSAGARRIKIQPSDQLESDQTRGSKTSTTPRQT